MAGAVLDDLMTGAVWPCSSLSLQITLADQYTFIDVCNSVARCGDPNVSPHHPRAGCPWFAVCGIGLLRQNDLMMRNNGLMCCVWSCYSVVSCQTAKSGSALSSMYTTLLPVESQTCFFMILERWRPRLAVGGERLSFRGCMAKQRKELMCSVWCSPMAVFCRAGGRLSTL